jgi:hypothetical protein
MGNRQPVQTNPQPDSLDKVPVSLSPGTLVTPIAENSEAIIFSTQFQSPLIQLPLKQSREIQTSLGQNHGKYIVRPKNNLSNGKVLQVKSLNPQPTKLYYVVRKQEDADRWLPD